MPIRATRVQFGRLSQVLLVRLDLACLVNHTHIHTLCDGLSYQRCIFALSGEQSPTLCHLLLLPCWPLMPWTSWTACSAWTACVDCGMLALGCCLRLCLPGAGHCVVWWMGEETANRHPWMIDAPVMHQWRVCVREGDAAELLLLLLLPHC